ncbi:beta-lactamase/transpeptidase-like protein [Epithele typhae]|uniref:beta-lactamase/transpeptidase-like protein n=1 Tax=Epithele typhae TaxID=378194 RepID=UPI002007EB01|nr:beta-lactamase/transpeptidase-like protein [Epithele typhae]KAH9924964.1 beta-lactamase/transpeptidase-like protein [Epithele typhae]
MSSHRSTGRGGEGMAAVNVRGQSGQQRATAFPQPPPFIEEIRQNASIPGVSIGVIRLGEDKQPPLQWISPPRYVANLCSPEGQSMYMCRPSDTFWHGVVLEGVSASVGILMYDFARSKNCIPLPPSVAAFGWDTKFHELLPEGLGRSLQEPDGTLDGWTTHRASIRDVLGHASVLQRHDFASAYELREKWSYNDQMYMLGVQLVAQYSGMSYADFLSTRIFGRLHMDDTTVWPSSRLAHSWNKDGRRILFWFNSNSRRHLKRAEDMIKWLAVWLNKGVDPVSNRTLFPEGVYEATTTARWIAKGQPSAPLGASILGYGMGWERWSYGSVDVVEHGGAIPGFSLLTGFSPENNIPVATRMILKRTFDDHSATSPSPCRTHAPKNMSTAPPSLSIARYAGLCASPGYAPIALCNAYVWATHVRMEHADGDAFDTTFTTILPAGYGRNTRAFEFSETGESGGPAEFNVRDGEVVGFSLVTDWAADAVAVGRDVEEEPAVWLCRPGVEGQ